jgi:predicted nicotinamide N-methyase
LGGGALPPTPPLSPSNCTSGSLETKSKINILELGAGIGLCGIFLKKQFPESIGQVVITDLPEAIEAINKNIELNSLSVEADCIRAEVLSWGIESDSSKVAIDVFGNRHIDYVIAADCVYWECLFAPFAETLVYFANRGSKIIIAHVRRWKKDGKFFDLCKRKGLTVTILDEIVGTDTNEHTGQSIRSIKRIYQICK